MSQRKKKPIKGIVVSNKMDKSSVVQVSFRRKHPAFAKFITRHKKIMFHDENNSTKIGDTVLVESCRPMSHKKRHTLLEIVSKAENI